MEGPEKVCEERERTRISGENHRKFGTHGLAHFSPSITIPENFRDTSQFFKTWNINYLNLHRRPKSRVKPFIFFEKKPLDSCP